MTEKDYVEQMARILALPKQQRNFVLSTENKYFVMLVQPFQCFTYRDDMEVVSYLDKKEAIAVLEELVDKTVQDGVDHLFKYGIFKLSEEGF